MPDDSRYPNCSDAGSVPALLAEPAGNVVSLLCRKARHCPLLLSGRHRQRESFAGARFVHELSDAQHGRAEGALMLLKIVERSIPYLPSTGTAENAIEGSRNSLFITETRKISDGYPSPPFIPPRGESAC